MQLDGHEWGYIHTKWLEYYCLDKNHALETLDPRFIGCQNPYQLQNIKIFIDISGVQKPTRAKFLEFRFFCLKRQGYINITRTKINLWSHHLHTKTVNVTFFLFLGSSISLLRQISSLSFQLSSGSFRSKCMRCILFKMYEACLLSTIHILIYL